MQELLALQLAGTSSEAVHEYIVRHKILTASLGDKLNSEWMLTALKHALVEGGTDTSKQIAITSLVTSIEMLAEEVARLNTTAPTTRNQRGQGAQLYLTTDYNPNPNASATREPC